MNESENTFDHLETLTVLKVAELLHVSRPTVEKHIKSGELPSVIIGRCRRVRRIDLEDFLEIHRTRDWQSYRPEAARQGDYRYRTDEFTDENDAIPF